MTPIVPLGLLQRRFCAWLREPDEDRTAELARGLDVGPGLVVYQNNYRVALVEALRETHARAALWLGDAAFLAAAARFIDAHPPSAWTIDAYGAAFPAALRLIDPVAADLAAIDRAICEAYGAADAVPVDATALGEVDWENIVVRPVPSLVQVPVATTADAIWLAMAADERAPPPAKAPGTVLVWRQGFEPVMRRASALECLILAQSLDGAAFATICEGLVSAGDAVTDAGTALGRWLGEGLIAALG